MFTKDIILPIAKKADYSDEFINEIGEYLDFVADIPDLQRELKKYYNTLFVDNDIFPIIKVESMPLPQKSEEKYKGFFELVVYLATAKHFENYIISNGFDIVGNIIIE